MKTHLDQLKLGAFTRFVRRKMDDKRLYGFALESNHKLTLLALVNDFQPNGFCVIRNQDVSRYVVFDDPSYVECRALRLLGVTVPPKPEIDIASFATVAISAATQFPLIVLNCELHRPHVCWVGRYRRHTKRKLTVDSIDPSAVWDGTEALRFRDLTMIGFGASYESGLWLVAQENLRAAKTGAN